jgi:hypothetical protein
MRIEPHSTPFRPSSIQPPHQRIRKAFAVNLRDQLNIGDLLALFRRSKDPGLPVQFIRPVRVAQGRDKDNQLERGQRPTIPKPAHVTNLEQARKGIITGLGPTPWYTASTQRSAVKRVEWNDSSPARISFSPAHHLLLDRGLAISAKLGTVVPSPPRPASLVGIRSKMKSSITVADKLARLGKPSAQPRVLDLFAGCGGLSLGFQAAGCEIVAAMETDELAACTHAFNFFQGQPDEVICHHARPKDVATVEPEELVEGLGLGRAAEAFDIIIGGPPCQAYARVGRAM